MTIPMMHEHTVMMVIVSMFMNMALGGVVVARIMLMRQIIDDDVAPC